jgi:hypothetical protein
MVKNPAVLLTTAVLIVIGVGCGSAEESDSASESKPPPPPSYKATVIDCLDELGYSSRKAGNATRVSSPNGSPQANIQFFSSETKALAFAAQLDTEMAPAEVGKKGVIIFYPGFRVGDAEKRVMADCLRNP